jgi:hypothetical protein
MILSSKELEKRLKDGQRLFDSDGQRMRVKEVKSDPPPPEPLKPEEPQKKESEIDYLRVIANILARQGSMLEIAIAKEQPKVEFPPVVVQPPKVDVHSPAIPAPPPRIRKWKFNYKDAFGNHREIIATALE